jgi:hypothetical protein
MEKPALTDAMAKLPDITVTAKKSTKQGAK